MSNKERVLLMDPHKADSIIADFLHRKKQYGPWQQYPTIDRKFVSAIYMLDHMLILLEYRVDIENLSSLAIVTFKIPDVTDRKQKALLPS